MNQTNIHSMDRDQFCTWLQERGWKEYPSSFGAKDHRSFAKAVIQRAVRCTSNDKIPELHVTVYTPRTSLRDIPVEFHIFGQANGIWIDTNLYSIKAEYVDDDYLTEIAKIATKVWKGFAE